MAKVYGDYCGFWRFWVAKNKAKQSQFQDNRIGRGLDSRLRGNDEYGIPARCNILTLFEKTKRAPR